MNQQLEQLALRAGFNLHNDIIDGHNFNHEIEKFAKLIAAECMSVVTNLSPNYPLRYKNNLLIEIHHRDQIEEVFRGDCVEEIKQHFGVVE